MYLAEQIRQQQGFHGNLSPTGNQDGEHFNEESYVQVGRFLVLERHPERELEVRVAAEAERFEVLYVAGQHVHGSDKRSETQQVGGVGDQQSDVAVVYPRERAVGVQRVRGTDVEDRAGSLRQFAEVLPFAERQQAEKRDKHQRAGAGARRADRDELKVGHEEHAADKRDGAGNGKRVRHEHVRFQKDAIQSAFVGKRWSHQS